MHSIYCDLSFPGASCAKKITGKLLYASVPYITHDGKLVRGACLESLEMGADKGLSCRQGKLQIIVVSRRHSQCLDHGPDEHVMLSARGVLQDVILRDQNANSVTVMAITDESEVFVKRVSVDDDVGEDEGCECVGTVTVIDPLVCRKH